ncbi:hypothetical protein Hte_006012 [Hypoxylon texense]
MPAAPEPVKIADVPWCAALLHAPDTLTFIPQSFATKEDAEVSSKDQLFRRTLRNEEAIPDCIGFYPDPKDVSDTTSPFLLASSSIIFDLRPGVNGYNGTVHGGLIAALMDESMGAYLYTNDRIYKQKKAEGLLPAASKGFEDMGFATSRMDVRLLKPIRTPQIVVVTTRLAAIDGRKVHFSVEVKGKEGKVYATCDGTWVSFGGGKL